MKRNAGKSRPSRRRGRRLLVGAAGVLLAAGLAAWWASGFLTASSGQPPRLVVDRADVDLGQQRFDTPVRAVFTLTNAGAGPLRLAEASPPVSLRAGC